MGRRAHDQGRHSVGLAIRVKWDVHFCFRRDGITIDTSSKQSIDQSLEFVCYFIVND